MKLRFTEKADKDYTRMPPLIRKSFAKQLRFLLNDRNHPSLHTKKYSEALNIWQGRVTRDWRFYFKIGGTNMSSSPSFPIPNNGTEIIPVGERLHRRVSRQGSPPCCPPTNRHGALLRLLHRA